MSALLRIHKWRKTNEEPKFKISVEEGRSKLDGMGIPKEAEGKVQMIARLKRLGATDDEIERAFQDLETSDHTDIRTGA